MNKQRWLITYREFFPSSASSIEETLEISVHPVEFLNDRSKSTTLVNTLRLHPEDPVLGEVDD